MAVVTGGSRGIGKGIALELAAAGCIVYITGRSTSTSSTELLLSGSVDQTVQAMRGVGVAAYVDHTQDQEVHEPHAQGPLALKPGRGLWRSWAGSTADWTCWQGGPELSGRMSIDFQGSLHDLVYLVLDLDNILRLIL